MLFHLINLMAFASLTLAYFMNINKLPKSKCENIKINECKTLGYNATTPLDMYSDVARNIEYGKNYIKFVSRYACSKNALFFLCSIYSPICFENSPEPILPCRSLCEQVKSNCSRYVKLAYLHWPKELKCDSLPEYHNGFCVTPDAFSSNENGRLKPQEGDLFTDNAVKCSCEDKRQKSRHLRKAARKAAFIIEAKMILRQTSALGKTKVVVNITNIYKKGSVPIKLGKTKLWAPTTCLCPKMYYNEKVYIMGQENAKQNRLIYDEQNTRVIRESAWAKHLGRWIEKYRKKNEEVMIQST